MTAAAELAALRGVARHLGQATAPIEVRRARAWSSVLQTSARNLVSAIDASRNKPFSIVLFALGLPGIGYVTAQALAEHFGTIDALLAADAERIEEVEGVGPITAAQIQEELAELAALAGPAFALEATSWGARTWLGASNLTPGASADLIVCAADPREHLPTLANPLAKLLRGVTV